MPPKKMSRYQKRRFTGRRGRRSNKILTNTRGTQNLTNKISVFPERYNFKGRVFFTNYLTNLATSYLIGAEHQFNLNSIFQPAVGVGNHAMIGWKELKVLYRKYKIRGVKIDLKIYNPDSDGQIVLIWLQQPDEVDGLAGKTVQQAGEKQDVIVKHISDTGSQFVKMTKYIPMHKLLGVSKMAMKSEDNYAANIGASPLKIPKLRIATANSRNVASNVDYTLDLTFYGTAYEREMLTISDPTA